MDHVAASKLAYLRDLGYRQSGVIVVGPAGCAVVSEAGRVTWQSASFERDVMGSESTEAERLRTANKPEKS